MGIFDFFKKKTAKTPPPEPLLNEQERLKQEASQSELIHKRESQYCDDRDFLHYNKEEYFRTPASLIIKKSTSTTADAHNAARSSHFVFFQYISVADLLEEVPDMELPQEWKADFR